MIKNKNKKNGNMTRVAYFGKVSLTQVKLSPMDCLTSKETALSRVR